jgi:hypothetical protein
MNRPSLLTIATLLGCLAALAVSFATGGTVGSGVMAGFLLGAAIGLFCLETLRRTSRVRPEYAFHAYLGTVFVKVLVMIGATLVLRFAEPLAARFEWRSFLIAYLAGALIVLVTGTPAAVRTITTEAATS